MTLNLTAYLGLAAISIALFAYVFASALAAGAEVYTHRFTKSSQATLEEMFVYMPPAWILNMKICASMAAMSFAWLMTIFLQSDIQRAIFMLIVGVPFFFVPDLLIKQAYKSRLKKFHYQMIDGLRTLANGLKANLSFPDALKMLADESPDPLSGEFRLALREMSLGLSLERALENLARRMPIQDLELFVASVVTVNRMGTGLTEICEKSIAIITERFRVEKRIESLTAEGRMQSYFLTAAPFVLMLFLFFIDPTLISVLFTTFQGMILLVTVIVLDLIGFLVIRKITDIQV